jgi:two-component system sensor histidine kinase RegB
MAVAGRNRLNFSWLLKLRWSSIAGQLATILGVQWGLGIELPLPELLVIVGVELLSNIACAAWFRRAPAVEEWHLAGVMAVDVALLTALLYFTGGPLNPFSFLYLVQIALAAVVLHAHWTWTLVALSFGAFGLLLLGHRRLPVAGLFDVHEKGMWVALGVASAFIVHFLLRVTGALAERERELGEARSLALRQERLASLATMAAGAAHELATPLGTIALVAKELERQLERAPDGAPPEQLEDVQLIRQQVARCRDILDRMSSGAGASAGEPFESTTVQRLLDEAMRDLRRAPPVDRQVAEEVDAAVLRVPPRAVAQALHSVITNAQDASPPDKVVELRAAMTDDAVEIRIRDHGRGMSPEIAARAGEPFFTTKSPGRGMGLGLFLTRAVIEKLGGRMTIESAQGKGTLVHLTLPFSREIVDAAPAAGAELQASA